MDVQTLLALYRTRLAEKRAAISELQLGVLLVTLPLTLHAALMLLVESHGFTERLSMMLPLSVLFGGAVLGGAVLTLRGVRGVRRASREVGRLSGEIVARVAPLTAGGGSERRPA